MPRQRIKKHLLLVITGLSAVLSLALAAAGFWAYHQSPVGYSYHLSDLAITRPIQIGFNIELSNNLSYRISPTVKGTWSTQRGLIGVRNVSFKPAAALPAGSKYTITLTNLHKLGQTTALPDEIIPITTQMPAAIISVTPANNAAQISINPTITIKLSARNNALRQLALTSSAQQPLIATTSSDDQTYSWHFAATLKQATTYQLYIDDLNQPDLAKRRLEATNFTTVTEPQVTAATSTNHFYPGNKVSVVFDQPMNQTAAPTFNMPGSGKWLSPTSYSFTPTSLKPGTNYTYTVPAGLASLAGGTVESNHAYNISPPSNLYVTSSSPSGSKVALNTTISFNFDQPVDQASAQTAFSMSPATNGTFSWTGDTMNFHPASLGYQTTYTATLGSGIISIYGLPSIKPFSQTFATTYQVTKLNVPAYMQQYAQSCEESALRMALAFRGIVVSDMDVLQRVGYNPRPRDTTTNTWDNPYTQFVGDLNGIQPTTGYGVFSGPIAAAAQSYGRSATAVSNITADGIVTQILAGNPVVVWGYSSHPRADSWNTSTGAVSTYVGEHARTVYGVAGKPGAVVGFYIHDPLYGDLYWTSAQLMNNLNTFGSISNQAVIVY